MSAALKSSSALNPHSVARALDGEATGSNIKCPGPGCAPTSRSLSVKLDPTARYGFLFYSHSGQDARDCQDHILEKLGIARTSTRANLNRREYVYKDEYGTDYIRVARYYKNAEKRFAQAHWNGAKWVNGTKGMPKLPYRLPELRAADPEQIVFVVEGEKDADRLASLGEIATTNSGGAGKWRPELNKHFAGRKIVILPDNDMPGIQHAEKVASALAPHARSIRVVKLPGLPEKGDASDWFDAGCDPARLLEICEATPPWAANDNLKPPADEAVPSNADYAAIEVVTEHDVALRFAEMHGQALRYCHDSGAWFQWDGSLWREDKTGVAFWMAGNLAHELSEAESGKTRAAIRKAGFASSVERFARHDRALAVTISNWDRDPFKLGTPGGTVDLRTGMLMPASQADGITKTIAITPSDTADCPRWLKFLDETTGSDRELICFLQQWAGYALTGDTREHALLFIYGPGGNGKSVFLNVLTAILKDYAAIASMDTFTASKSERHPADLAMLRGARLVTASETEEGKAWAEAKIKSLTGGDPVSARFMRQDFFTYTPQFKLTIIGNHKPVLHNVDDAMRRRFNIVPFLRKPAIVDRELETKLQAEYPGILRWMIAGCLDWQANGLVRPASADEATREYFDAQDTFGQWLADECDLDVGNPYKSESSALLFASWKVYAARAGEDAGTAKRFADNLAGRGPALVKRVGGRNGPRGFIGIRIKLTQSPGEQ